MNTEFRGAFFEAREGFEQLVSVEVRFRCFIWIDPLFDIARLSRRGIVRVWCVDWIEVSQVDLLDRKFPVVQRSDFYGAFGETEDSEARGL